MLSPPILRRSSVSDRFVEGPSCLQGWAPLSISRVERKNLGLCADRYASLAGFDGDWRDSWWHQDTLELMAERLGFAGIQSVLDVGCGAGHWGQRVATLLPEGASIAGIDHEEGFLDAARERAKRFSHARFDYRLGRVESLPFPDGSFDLVTCQTVLIHVADARVALREMVRVAKPGGLVVAAEPNNRFNAIATRTFEPPMPFEDVLSLVGFDDLCIQGKLALGQGDSAVGERLASLFLDLDLEDRRVYKNDCCADILPPYERPAERQSLEIFMREESISSWGDEATTRRLYLAGGGAPERFDALWALDMESRRRVRELIRAKQYRFTGGLLMYLAAGRKTAGQR